jgi:hypothetical protein
MARFNAISNGRPNESGHARQAGESLGLQAGDAWGVPAYGLSFGARKCAIHTHVTGVLTRSASLFPRNAPARGHF